MRHIFLSFVSLFANVYYCLRYVKIRSRNISAFGEINYKKKNHQQKHRKQIVFVCLQFCFGSKRNAKQK